jgi:MOSC domain-containing protein YiiM
MRVVSLNVGLPRDVVWHGRTVTTGIYKNPVDGRRVLRRLNLDGDGQADLTVHGGAFKAAYCYPIEHYAPWQAELGRELPFGMFGENFTTDGLDEDSVHIGDRFSIGTAHVVVTQPRLPCYKLGIRFEDDGMIKRFLASGRTGFYVAVEHEGDVGAGDAIALAGRDPDGVRVADITRLYVRKTFSEADVATIRRALRVAALPESWKAHFQQRLAAQEP